LAKAPDRPHAYSFDLMTRWIERYRREAEGRFLRLEAVLDRMEEQPVRGTSTKKAAS
jgi:N-acyl-D-aspartate/D-glutamate deacylase